MHGLQWLFTLHYKANMQIDSEIEALIRIDSWDVSTYINTIFFSSGTDAIHKMININLLCFIEIVLKNICRTWVIR